MGGVGSHKLGKLRTRGPRAREWATLSAAPRQARLHRHSCWNRFLLKGDNGIDETGGPEGLSCPWGREQCPYLLTNWRWEKPVLALAASG